MLRFAAQGDMARPLRGFDLYHLPVLGGGIVPLCGGR